MRERGRAQATQRSQPLGRSRGRRSRARHRLPLLAPRHRAAGPLRRRGADGAQRPRLAPRPAGEPLRLAAAADAGLGGDLQPLPRLRLGDPGARRRRPRSASGSSRCCRASPPCRCSTGSAPSSPAAAPASLAAFLLACSHWAARSGRTGLGRGPRWSPSNSPPSLAWCAAIRRDRLAPAIAAGALIGLSLYTYVASWLVALHAFSWLGWEAIAARRELSPERSPSHGLAQRSLARWLVTSTVAIAIAAPLLSHRLGAVRVSQLSVFSPRADGDPWLTIADNVVGHLLMFNLRGGAYARDALPGFPMLDPLTGALFLLGLFVVVREPVLSLIRRLHRRRRAGERRGYALLLSWPALMVLGGVLSTSGEGPPYPYRVLALAPWACLVAAIGATTVWDAVAKRWAMPLRRAAATLVLGGVVAINAWVLFIAAPADPGTRHVYGVAPTSLGRWLADHAQGRPVVISRTPSLPPRSPPATPTRKPTPPTSSAPRTTSSPSTSPQGSTAAIPNALSPPCARQATSTSSRRCRDSSPSPRSSCCRRPFSRKPPDASKLAAAPTSATPPAPASRPSSRRARRDPDRRAAAAPNWRPSLLTRAQTRTSPTSEACSTAAGR